MSLRETIAGVLEEVATERWRQVSVCGWTPGDDDAHDQGELGRAAAAYATPPSFEGAHWLDLYTRDIWPWRPDVFKRKDRRRDLVRAAALIVAEIERLDRSALSKAQPIIKEASGEH